MRLSMFFPTLIGKVSASSLPTAAAARREEIESVRRAIAALTPRDRSLIQLRFTDGMSYAEIAAAEGIVSEEAACKAVGAARARLLVQLRRTDFR